MDSRLQEVLDGIIQDKTFSMEAVGAIKALRDDLQEEKDKSAKLFDELMAAEKQNDSLSDEYRRINDEIRGWQARDEDLGKRESNIAMLERSEAVAQSKADAIGLCFDTVFRNTVFRESFNKTVPNGVDQYGTSQTANEFGDVTRTQESEGGR